MEEKGRRAAGGGLPLEERRDRARRAQMRRMPAPARAQQVPGGTSTLGITLHLKDYGWAKDHRGGGDVHGSPGLRRGET